MKTDMKEFFQTKLFKGILIGIATMLVILVIFQIGVVVGYHRARFEGESARPYQEILNSHQGFGNGGAFGPISDGHGAAGSVVSVALPDITIADVSGIEKTVIVETTTIIREYQNTLTAVDLKPGMNIVVFGDPDAKNDIEARFIRIVPADGSATTLPPTPVPAMPSQ